MSDSRGGFDEGCTYVCRKLFRIRRGGNTRNEIGQDFGAQQAQRAVGCFSEKLVFERMRSRIDDAWSSGNRRE